MAGRTVRSAGGSGGARRPRTVASHVNEKPVKGEEQTGRAGRTVRQTGSVSMPSSSFPAQPAASAVTRQNVRAAARVAGRSSAKSSAKSASRGVTRSTAQSGTRFVSKPSGQSGAASASSGTRQTAKSPARNVSHSFNPFARTVSKPASSRAGKPREVASHQDGEARFRGRNRGTATVERSSSTDVTVAKGRAGAFVDARRLRSEDYVTETLHQTTGMLGIASRPKVVDFTERAKERKRASARVIAVRVLAALAGAAVLAGLTWLLFFSTVFRLETGAISVTGANEWVSAQTIHAIADKQAGKSLFLVSTNDVANQLKDIPGVSEAKVSRRFPKAMNVQITAQKPAAMLKSGDTLTAVDAEARVLNSVSSKDVDGIPVIEVKDVQTSLKNRSVKEALTILGALPESMRQQITKVTAETQDSVTTTLDGGERVIVWGDSSQLKLKMAVVDKIINDPNVIGERHQVDVSAPLKPIIK